MKQIDVEILKKFLRDSMEAYRDRSKMYPINSSMHGQYIGLSDAYFEVLEWIMDRESEPQCEKEDTNGGYWHHAYWAKDCDSEGAPLWHKVEVLHGKKWEEFRQQQFGYEKFGCEAQTMHISSALIGGEE